MLFEIFKFEILYRLKRPETYVFFAALFLYSLISVEFIFSDLPGTIKANAPNLIARTMGISTAFFMIVVSIVMGTSVLRDFDHGMESLMFINPITKRQYLAGRFLGSFVILLGIFTAILLGVIIGDYMPWRDANNLLTFNLWMYLQPFFFVVVPTLFIGGSLFFVTGALTRKLMVVYTQGILFLLLYMFTLQLTQSSSSEFIAAIFDPFSFKTIAKITEFWSPLERNTLLVPIEGVFLYNRLLWIGLGIATLFIGYIRFDFRVVRDMKNRKKKVQTLETSKFINTDDLIPSPTIHFDIKTMFHQIKNHSLFYFKSVLKETSFWAIAACAIITIFINSINLDTSYDVDSYPVTYLIISELIELSVLFFLLIILFYSGELIWKERDSKINQIFDALPISDFINLTGKFIGLVLILGLLLVFMMLAGILFQTVNVYYDYNLELYFMEFFAGIFPFLILLTFIAFFFQSVLNNKFVAHIGVVVFLFVGIGLMNQFGWSHPLLLFGGSFLPTFSDMNGYGHLLEPYLWIKSYWFFFCIMLFVLSVLLMVRGTETSFKKRLNVMPLKLTRPLVRVGVGALLFFILSGGYIFYNTNVLNEFAFQSSKEVQRVDYEKTLKQFEYLPQPKIVDVYLEVDLFPEERNFDTKGEFILVNKHEESIQEIHIQKTPSSNITLDSLQFKGGSIPKTDFEDLGYYIHTLNNPLYPGDTLKMTFRQTFRTQGFEQGANTTIVYNGTFLNHFYFPTIGYNELVELEDNDSREDYGLEPKLRRAAINDSLALREGLSGDDGEEIDFEIIVSTSSTQKAIAPGYLQNQWTEKSRSFYHYKMDKPMANFYSIVSADYEILADVLDDTTRLEIYFQKGHEYNLDRMMNGMKKSLHYFNEHFSPYQYDQLRIMEFPRYEDFAQSYPNTIPFSEALGFIMDIDDERDVDMAFYITAHETAHQWWGLLVNPANVQGKTMISESLAQYSALMVLKQEFSEEKVSQFLDDQRKLYLRQRASEDQQEMPLSLVVTGQQYVYYNKGVVNLYAFQDYISEDSVNMALHRFIRDWNSVTGTNKLQTDRYPTTQDLISYFREVTPDSLQYVVEDLFETVTLHENKAFSANYEETPDNRFKVHMTVEASKFRVNEAGAEIPVAINDWIDIGIYSTNENGKEELIYLKKHRIIDGIIELEITVDQKPVKAGIDPLNKLIDRESEDNIFEVFDDNQ